MTDAFPAISPGKRVWSIPHIRASILTYLPRGDLFTLLTVSKSHFEAAVGVLYGTYPYRYYHKYIIKCKNNDHKAFYKRAVRTINAVGSRRRDVDKRVNQFKFFPNATRLDFNHNARQHSLYRDLDRHPRTYRFVQNARGAEHFRGRNDPLMQIQVPQTWAHHHTWELSVRDQLDGRVHQDHVLDSILRNLQGSPVHLFGSFSISSDNSNEPLLRNLINIVVGEGQEQFSPKSLTLDRWHSGELLLLRQLGASLQALTLLRSNSTRSSGLSVDEFLHGFHPVEYPLLGSLYLEFREPAEAPQLLETINANETIVVCSLPRKGLWSVHEDFEFMFSPSQDPSSPLDSSREVAIIRRLVRHLMPLVDAYRPPELHFACHRMDPITHSYLMRGELDLRGAFRSEFRCLIDKALKQGKCETAGQCNEEEYYSIRDLTGSRKAGLQPGDEAPSTHESTCTEIEGSTKKVAKKKMIRG